MKDLFLLIGFTIFFFFLPGWQTLRRLPFRMNRPEKFFLSLAVGIAQLTLVGYLGAQSGWRWLVWGLVGWGLLTAVRWSKVVAVLGRRRLPPWIWLVLFAAVFQVLVMVKSGTGYQGGLAFWGVHGHDGIWHTALIQELARPFPPQNPGFAGVGLQNYHYFFDLLGAEIYRLTGVSILDLYFRFLPLLLAVTANGLVFTFLRRWTGNGRAAGWAVFFFAFSSSLGFLLPWLGKGSANWETAFWAMQPATSLQNPPFYLSLVFILAFFQLLAMNEEESRRGLALWLPAMLAGMLMTTKVYGGLVLLAAGTWVGFWRLILHKKKMLLQLFTASLVVGIFLYVSIGGNTAGFIRWSPGWFLRIMLEAPDRMNWAGLEMRRLNYAASGRWFLSGVIWLAALSFFLTGNFGTRLVAFLNAKKEPRSPVGKILLMMVVFGILPTLLFTQEYVAWNTIQFFYYAIFALGLLAGPGMARLTEKIGEKRRRMVLIMAVIGFSLPGSLRTLSWYLAPVPTTRISGQELAALNWLRDNSPSDAVVLVFPHQPGQEEKYPSPTPLAYYNTAYVAFFSGRRVYLEDETAAYIQGYDYVSRRDLSRRFFAGSNREQEDAFLAGNKIDYLYLVEDQSWPVGKVEAINPVFALPTVRVYRF